MHTPEQYKHTKAKLDAIFAEMQTLISAVSLRNLEPISRLQSLCHAADQIFVEVGLAFDDNAGRLLKLVGTRIAKADSKCRQIRAPSLDDTVFQMRRDLSSLETAAHIWLNSRIGVARP